jgi:hypothetical protein
VGFGDGEGEIGSYENKGDVEQTLNTRKSFVYNIEREE